MATSGSKSTNTTYDSYFWVSWYQNWQSIEDNCTSIHWSCGVYCGHSFYSNAIKMSSVYINGSNVYGGGTYSNYSKGNHTIASGDLSIGHNSDGTKTFSIGSFSGWLYSNNNYSADSSSYTLSTIPRKSDLSVSATSILADGSSTITATATKKSSSFTDKLTFTLGNQSKTITSGTAFSIPLSWCSEMPSATSKTGKVTCTTYNGSTEIGSSSIDVTVKVPDSVVPTISSVSVTEANSDVTTYFGSRFVQNLTKLLCTATASGVQGSSISSYRFAIDGTSYIGNGSTTNTLLTSGTLNLVTTVTDTRGRSASNTKSITVIAYEKPSIQLGFSVSGTTLTLSMKGAVSSVEEQNTQSIVIKYKKMSASSYSTVTITPSDWSFDQTKTFTIDPTVTYEFIATLTDKVASVIDMLRTGIPVISRHAGGDGVTFGAEASTSGVVLGTSDWDIKIEDADLQTSLVAVLGSSIIV